MMQILKDPQTFDQKISKSIVTIGNFDGVHRGHAAIFNRVTSQGATQGLSSVVVTFEPHPLKVLAPELAPQLITTFDQKAALIAAAGIEYLAVIPFTAEFSLMPAESFVREILCRSLGMRHIIIGHDYAFGRNRQGNFETLSRLGDECGFLLEDLDPVGQGKAVFSSSLARRMISGGDMAGASAILGRYHVISGRVVHGREMGHKLGFPTANIATPNELVPPDGIYAVMVAAEGRLYKGACSIGTNPTFDGKERSIEVFLLDFSGKLYDSEIALCFVRRLRDMIKFPDADALIRAINSDVAATREILAEVEDHMIAPLIPGFADRGSV